MITAEFDLPVGYGDESGTVHHHVVMRRSTCGDIVAVNRSPRVLELAQKGIKVDIKGTIEAADNRGGEQAEADGKRTFSLEGANPVANFAVQAAVHEMYVELFLRVVVSIGDIKTPGRDVYMAMTPSDIQFMTEQYEKLNAPPKVIKDTGEGAAKPDPLAR